MAKSREKTELSLEEQLKVLQGVAAMALAPPHVKQALNEAGRAVQAIKAGQGTPDQVQAAITRAAEAVDAFLKERESKRN